MISGAADQASGGATSDAVQQMTQAGRSAAERLAKGSPKTPTAQRVEVHDAFRFVVDIQGGEVFFTECTLPDLEMEVTEQREGGHNTGVCLLPGPVKVGRIILRRGITRSSKLLSWYAQAAKGDTKGATRNVSVTMLDSQGDEVLRLSFIRAFPLKWSGPSLKAGDSAIAIETLELGFEEVLVEDGGGGGRPAAAASGAGAGNVL